MEAGQYDVGERTSNLDQLSFDQPSVGVLVEQKIMQEENIHAMKYKLTTNIPDKRQSSLLECEN